MRDARITEMRAERLCESNRGVTRRVNVQGDEGVAWEVDEGRMDLDETERWMDRVSRSEDCVEGLEGPVKFTDLSWRDCSRHGGDGLKAGLRFECAE